MNFKKGKKCLSEGEDSLNSRLGKRSLERKKKIDNFRNFTNFFTKVM